MLLAQPTGGATLSGSAFYHRSEDDSGVWRNEKSRKTAPAPKAGVHNSDGRLVAHGVTTCIIHRATPACRSLNGRGGRADRMVSVAALDVTVGGQPRVRHVTLSLFAGSCAV